MNISSLNSELPAHLLNMGGTKGGAKPHASLSDSGLEITVARPKLMLSDGKTLVDLSRPSKFQELNQSEKIELDKALKSEAGQAILRRMSLQYMEEIIVHGNHLIGGKTLSTVQGEFSDAVLSPNAERTGPVLKEWQEHGADVHKLGSQNDASAHSFEQDVLSFLYERGAKWRDIEEIASRGAHEKSRKNLIEYLRRRDSSLLDAPRQESNAESPYTSKFDALKLTSEQRSSVLERIEKLDPLLRERTFDAEYSSAVNFGMLNKFADTAGISGALVECGLTLKFLREMKPDQLKKVLKTLQSYNSDIQKVVLTEFKSLIDSGNHQAVERFLSSATNHISLILEHTKGCENKSTFLKRLILNPDGHLKNHGPEYDALLESQAVKDTAKAVLENTKLEARLKEVFLLLKGGKDIDTPAQVLSMQAQIESFMKESPEALRCFSEFCQAYRLSKVKDLDAIYAQIRGAREPMDAHLIIYAASQEARMQMQAPELASVVLKNLEGKTDSNSAVLRAKLSELLNIYNRNLATRYDFQPESTDLVHDLPPGKREIFSADLSSNNAISRHLEAQKFPDETNAAINDFIKQAKKAYSTSVSIHGSGEQQKIVLAAGEAAYSLERGVHMYVQIFGKTGGLSDRLHLHIEKGALRDVTIKESGKAVTLACRGSNGEIRVSEDNPFPFGVYGFKNPNDFYRYLESLPGKVKE
ncbi:MAG: hypothetical protein K2X27_11180 [Candidatus Obscuribacterales bacterium]|nr:hypothetical protein [Candidatus Obscuribacterales bacterium]